MQKVCVNHHRYDAFLDKCPFCSEKSSVNTQKNEIVSDDTMKSCANGHFYPATLEECPYCKKETEDRAYLTHLCPGCMTYLDQSDLPCPFCGWKIFICPVECMFGVNNTAYLIMEYIEGQTIEDYVSKTGPMSFAGSLKLLSPIFEAIDKLHKRNIFHLLLNPKNIILTNDGVRLIDFHDESYMHQLQLNLGETLIVREFIAPEFETNSAKMGVPIDMYNLAAILYYTITGKAPANSYEHMVGRKVEPPSALGADITSLQESALLKGLATSPSDRYQTMREFYNALIDMQDSNGGTSNITGKIKKVIFNFWK